VKLSDRPDLEKLIEGRIEVWHNTPQGCDLSEALGLTCEQYSDFVMNNELPDDYIFPE
jgi:hypothetical protein